MTILKITDRAEILRIVLTKSFEPKFNKVRDKIQQKVKDALAKDHSVFCKLYADEEARKYLAVGRVRSVCFMLPGGRACSASPVFGKFADMPENNYNLDREYYSSLKPDDIYTPTALHELNITDKTLTQLYVKTWADYSAAERKLSALLNSYATREKLSVDFPEFAKHLPRCETKAKLPAIIVKDVRKELSALGVPAK